jgi:hypothetical protein
MTLFSEPRFGAILFGWGGVILVVLWHIAAELKAIRASLADIAMATRETARGMDTTEKLLKLAIKKQWGSAIDLPPRY